jgi:peptidoglycan/xylan/chitin deacetylase (PgdA/CDA1 family)
VKRPPLKVILTHDVDWPPAGPGLEHIRARRDRFEGAVMKRVERENFNPYNNIDLLMDLEEKHGMKSTFFFRPRYDDGTPVSAYADSIRTLMGRGWEVGAHLNDAESLESVASQRELIGDVCGFAPTGCRIHYLRLGPNSHSFIRRAGFRYDSSVMVDKHAVTPLSAGYLASGRLIVFPITIMDTYLFTYMKVQEDKVPRVVESALNDCVDRGYMTILWHDSSVLMKGGRAYARICELLQSREDVECVTAIEAYRSVSRGGSG